MRKARLRLFLLAYCLSIEAHAWDNLGRLFTTPEQRERIDAVRFGQQASDTQPDRVVGQEVDRELWVFNGVLMGEDGHREVWINGHRRDRGVSLRLDGSVLLELPASGTSVRLKPGQAVDPLTGQVMEPWEMSGQPVSTTGETDTEAAPASGPEPGEGDRDTAEEVSGT